MLFYHSYALKSLVKGQNTTFVDIPLSNNSSYFGVLISAVQMGKMGQQTADMCQWFSPGTELTPCHEIQPTDSTKKSCWGIKPAAVTCLSHFPNGGKQLRRYWNVLALEHIDGVNESLWCCRYRWESLRWARGGRGGELWQQLWLWPVRSLSKRKTTQLNLSHLRLPFQVFYFSPSAALPLMRKRLLFEIFCCHTWDNVCTACWSGHTGAMPWL